MKVVLNISGRIVILSPNSPDPEKLIDLIRKYGYEGKPVTIGKVRIAPPRTASSALEPAQVTVDITETPIAKNSLNL